MQKRAISLAYHSDEIKVSVGGGVNAGELPEKAILREVKKELNLNVNVKELHFTGKTKPNHKTKKQRNKSIKTLFIVIRSIFQNIN